MQKLYFSNTPLMIPFFSMTTPETPTLFERTQLRKQKTKNEFKELSPVVQVACGDHFSLALTQSGRLYCWGLASDGRLGLRKISGKQVTDKSEHTCIPQLLNFTNGNVESIYACGQIAYCDVNSIVPAGQPGAGTMKPAIYLWGKIPRGLNMKLYD